MDLGECAMTTITDLDDFKALDPFFRIIEQALAGVADGAHFFDLLAEDVEFDFIITVPNYPRHVVGRAAVAELYRPYGQALTLNRCFDLAVHHDRETGTIVLETRRRAKSSQPAPPTPTATSQSSPSSTEKSADAAI